MSRVEFPMPAECVLLSPTDLPFRLVPKTSKTTRVVHTRVREKLSTRDYRDSACVRYVSKITVRKKPNVFVYNKICL